MSQPNKNLYFKKNESQKSVFSKTGENSIKRLMTPNKRIKNINIFNIPLTEKYNYLKDIEIMKKKKLFEKESIKGQLDPDEKNIKNSKISDIINLSPSKLENKDEDKTSTSIVVNEVLGKKNNPNQTDDNFTNIVLKRNFINQNESKNNEQSDNFFDINILNQYFDGEQLDKYENKGNNININNNNRGVIQDYPENILGNKENFNNNLLEKAPYKINFNNSGNMNKINLDN